MSSPSSCVPPCPAGAALFARGQLFLHALDEQEEEEKEEEEATSSLSWLSTSLCPSTTSSSSPFLTSSGSWYSSGTHSAFVHPPCADLGQG